jgi:glycosyltransferase involved in cell wall biosynthesis
MPFFTIITINLNNRQGLENTIKSVRNQAFHDFEYIVVDGVSSDGSLDIIEKNADLINKKIIEKDSGVYNAMNKGLAHASGEYILFLNSGDELKHRESLMKINEKAGGKDLVYCDVDVFEGDNSVVKSHPDHLTTNYLLTDMICHQAVFARKSLFDRIGGFDESFKIYADYEWMMRAILLNQATTRHLARVLVRYEAIGLSNTANKKLQREEKDRIHDKYFNKAFVLVYRLYRGFNDWKDGVNYNES